MATLYTQQSKNVYKTWSLMIGFFVVVILLGWVFSLYFGSPIILYIAVGIAIIMNVFSYWNSDKIVIKMSGARPVTRESHRDFWNIVENLSITAGLPMPKVYIIKDEALNAFTTGRNKEQAVVAVTTGLLAALEKPELEGVIAHELSHIGNRDMLLSTIVVVLVGFVAILADVFRRHLFFNRNRDNDNKMQGILVLVGIILSILAPIFTVLIQLAISRKREFLADSSGALLTRYPEGLASALCKISQNSKPMARQSKTIAHLYIADPKGVSFGQKVSGLFATHPRVEERIKALIGV